MYRRTKFLEVLIEIRQEMAREADYDVDLFAEYLRSNHHTSEQVLHSLTVETTRNAETDETDETDETENK